MDCYNAYGVYISPPPEQTPGEWHPLGDPSDPTDPDYLPEGDSSADFWEDPLELFLHHDDHEF